MTFVHITDMCSGLYVMQDKRLGTTLRLDSKLFIFWTDRIDTYTIPSWVDSDDPIFYVMNPPLLTTPTVDIEWHNRKTGVVQTGVSVDDTVIGISRSTNACVVTVID